MTGKGKVMLPPVSQVCIVVKDIAKAAEYYTSTFGIGPFSIQEAKMEGVILRGKPTTTKIKVALAQSGSLQIELIQPVEGENPYAEFLASKGEGLHHLGFQVDDLDSIVAELAKEGIEPIFHHDFGFLSFAYLNTDQIGGVIFELICPKQKTKE